MSTPAPDLLLTRRVGVWNRAVQTDFRKLFAALSKAALNAGTGNLTAAGINVTDVVSAVGLAPEAGVLTWLLTPRALLEASYELAAESQIDFVQGLPPQAQALGEALDRALGETEVSLDSKFFEVPDRLPILDAFEDAFGEWLKACGLAEEVAKPTRRSTAARRSGRRGSILRAGRSAQQPSDGTPAATVPPKSTPLGGREDLNSYQRTGKEAARQTHRAAS